MANVFDMVTGTEHVVAESSMLHATHSGHIYSLKMMADTDNGTIVSVGKFVEEQVFEAAAYAAGKKPYLILTPPFGYNGKKAQMAEKYFYNAKDEIARAYELHNDDIYTLSADAFTGTPAVGSYVDATYAVTTTEPASGFVGEIIEEVNYVNSKAYRIVVRNVNKVASFVI